MGRRKGLTLLELQGKLKREPDAYKDDFCTQLRHFESTLQVFEMRPAKESKQFSELLSFISQTAPLYGPVAQHIPQLLIKVVERHSSSINPKTRRQIVMALALMRNRDFVAPEVLLPFLFRLFKLHDKELRKHVLSHIINDIKRLNSSSKNQKVNSILQNFMYKVLEEDDVTAAQYSLIVMIDLYRRRIWTSDQTVNIIAKALFSKHTKIMMIALKFFLGKYAKVSVEEAESKEEEEKMTDHQLGKGRRETMYKFKKAAKKTRARHTHMKKNLKKLEKQRNKEEAINTLFPAVEVLHDPQGLGERLFGVLQKSHEKFDIRLLIMQVLSKFISCHELIILNFYPYLERHMEPYHRDVTHILLVAIESLHRMIPPETCQPLMMTMANHFINDKADPDVITVGLNTVREMCRRQPLMMTESFLHDISEYKGYKKDKGVSMAAKSVIYLYRELHPTMLKKKDRGKFHDAENKLDGFGAPKPQDKVIGTELLYKFEIEEQQKNIERAMDRAALKEEREALRAANRKNKAASDKSGASDAGKDEDYEWQVSEDEDEAKSDGSGEWVDVSDDSEAEGRDDGSDEDEDDESVESGEQGVICKEPHARAKRMEGETEDEDADDEEEEIEDEEDESETEEQEPKQSMALDDDCPQLVPVDAEQTDISEDEGTDDTDDEEGEEMEEDEGEDGDEEEEDSEEEDDILKNIDPLKLEAQKRQMLLDMQKAAEAPPSVTETSETATIALSSVFTGSQLAPPSSDALTRILTPRDFERIQKLLVEKKRLNVAPSTLKRRQKREELMAALTEETLEFGTDKRTKEKREEKREQNALYREKFKASRKKERKGGGSTHKDKERRKSTIMVKHKESITRKRKLSVKQKNHASKRRKKTISKFKIKRGI